MSSKTPRDIKASADRHRDHPHECNICGVWLGFQTDREYCESCAHRGGDAR